MSWAVPAGNGGTDSTVLSKISSFIDSRLSTVAGWASTASTAAGTAISGVGTFTTPSITLTTPSSPTLGPPPSSPQTNPVPDQAVTNSPSAAGFSVVDSLAQPEHATVPTPVFGTAVDADPVPRYALPTLEAKFTNLAKPTLPNEPRANFAEKPRLDLPGRPTMDALQIEHFNFPTIEPFEEELPHYDISGDAEKLDEKLGDFTTNFERLLDTLSDQEKLFHDNTLRWLLEAKEGDTDTAAIDTEKPDWKFTNKGRADLQHQAPGYAGDRKLALRHEGQEVVNKVDRELMTAVKQTITKYSNRNFPFFGGAAAAEVTELHMEAAEKIRQSRPQVVSRMNDKTIKDWTFWRETMIDLERHARDFMIFEAQKRLDIQKLSASAQLEIFNATVQLYNMEQDARLSYAEAYKAELESRLRVLETWQPLIDSAIAKYSENEVQVQMYVSDVSNKKAEVEAYTTYLKTLAFDIKVYNEKVRGLKAEADTTATNIEAYREAVKAYAASVEASGTSIKSFAEQVQAESSIIDVSNANVQAYAEYMQQTAKQFEVDKAFASGHGDLLRTNISAYQSAVQVEESRVRALIAAVEGRADIAAARASALGSVIPAYSAYNRANAAKAEAMRAYALAAAENATQAAALSATAKAATDKVNAGAAAAKAVAAAALAQGAMSAMYVSKSVQGAVSQSVSASKDTSAAESFGIYDSTLDTFRGGLNTSI